MRAEEIPQHVAHHGDASNHSEPYGYEDPKNRCGQGSDFTGSYGIDRLLDRRQDRHVLT